MSDSISAFVSVYKNQRAVFEALKSFRTHYKNAPITIASDAGDDFSRMAEAFGAKFIRYDVRMVKSPEDIRGNARVTLDGIYDYFDRLYEHCISTDTDWVISLETDVRTLRKIRTFPQTAAAGNRLNPFSVELQEYLAQRFGPRNYGYGMAGGSIWRRQAYIDAYNGNRDVGSFERLDYRVAVAGDVALTLLFIINGFDYSEWEEISEIFHDNSPIIRDSAFDHAYKYWYGKDYDESLLSELEL